MTLVLGVDNGLSFKRYWRGSEVWICLGFQTIMTWIRGVDMTWVSNGNDVDQRCGYNWSFKRSLGLRSSILCLRSAIYFLELLSAFWTTSVRTVQLVQKNCLLQYLRVLSGNTGTTLRILRQLVCDGLRTIWRGNNNLGGDANPAQRVPGSPYREISVVDPNR